MYKINIVMKGIYPIPEEVHVCPVCGHVEKYSYLDRFQVFNGEEMEKTGRISNVYPTFICDRCNTMWQYLGEE